MMKILVGFDRSNTAKAALDVAIKYAGTMGGELMVVSSLVEGKDDNLHDIGNAESDLDAAKAMATKAGVPCTTHLLIRGLQPGEDLVRFAGEQGADLVVVGIHRRSKVGKLLMGSTAQFVILKSPCPVLTVK
ncbi:MAG: universal stress protein [Pseudomonadota bacterium]